MTQVKLYPLNPLIRAAEERSRKEAPCTIGAFNLNFFAQAMGILDGLIRAESPGIIQASYGACKFQGGADRIISMLHHAMDIQGREHAVPPICGHLDHGTYENCVSSMDGGFSSVMNDSSTKKTKKGDKTVEEKRSAAENASLTRPIVLAAHERGISVEGEMGVLAGQEDDVKAENSIYPTSSEVIDYVRRSGVDAVAVACGTCHGPIKNFKRLESELLRDSYEGLKKAGLEAGLVLHGSSTVPQDLVAEIRKYGGVLKDASGVPIEAIKEAIACGVRKVNIDTDLRLGITATVRSYIRENPDVVRKSAALGLIKAVFDGKYPAKDKDGNPVNPAGMTDPRSYLEQLMTVAPEFLREDYRTLGDPVYADMMDLVRKRVADHVYSLVKVFNSQGLAEKVSRPAL